MSSLKQLKYPYLLLGILGLFLVYLFQDYLDFYTFITTGKIGGKLGYTTDFKDVDMLQFTINKLGRYLLNDAFAIAIIYGLLGEKKYVRFAMYVLLFGLLILLPVYIVLYVNRPKGFSSMLSHLHRLVLNPVLMMLLIPPFFYQKYIKKDESK